MEVSNLAAEQESELRGLLVGIEQVGVRAPKRTSANTENSGMLVVFARP